MRRAWIAVGLIAIALAAPLWAHYDPMLFAVEFPDSHIPVVDGDHSDWSMIPAIPYEVGNDMYSDALFGRARGEIDVSVLSVRTMVGWNDNNNRIYLMAEVYDKVHKSTRTDPGAFWMDDAWEIYMSPSHPEEDGGGPNQPGAGGVLKHSWKIAVPPVGGNWGAFRPSFEWRTDPFNNDTWKLAWTFEGEEFGESTYFYEIWIQPLDFIPDDGNREASVETELYEGKIMAISWTFGDWDDEENYAGFWSTSPNACCRADNDLLLLGLDDSIDWGVAPPTSVTSDTWGRIKSQFGR